MNTIGGKPDIFDRIPCLSIEIGTFLDKECSIFCLVYFWSTLFVSQFQNRIISNTTNTHSHRRNNNHSSTTMMLGHPFYDDDYSYGGNHGFSPYGGGFYRQRQAAAAREARRRAELERYYRMKELEEQERLRQRQAYERMLRQKQQEEEAARRRRAYELELLRHAQEDYDEEEKVEEEDEDQYPNFRLVQGPDGRIYRVALGYDNQGLKKRKSQTLPVNSPQASADKENTSPWKQNAPVKIAISRKDEQPVVISDNFLPEKQNMACETKKERPKSRQSKKRVTVIVEDASDSETEDDEFKSVWRNRRPSPGEWMEPIEDFDKTGDSKLFNGPR